MIKVYLSIIVLVLVSCTSETTEQYNREQDATVANQARLTKAQPPPKLTWSLERDNLIKRTNLWNDPNKVSYIYLINYGKVMAFYAIKGKVSSVNSQVTNTEQIIYYRNTSDACVLPSPSEDGSYGTNGNAVFFFTTDGTYIEWNGDFMLCDKPLKLKTEPELVRVVE